MQEKYSEYLKQYDTVEVVQSEPWPQDAILYQPYEAEQILLPEQASCLAVKTYLKMCDLPFEAEQRSNAEFMSPGGRMTKLPFIRVGAFVIAEFEQIVKHVEQKKAGLGQWLDEDDMEDMRTYVAMVENIFTMAELYVSYMDDRVYKEVTAPRNGCFYPWPLNVLQNSSKRRHARKILKVYQWESMTMDQVVEKVSKCCTMLTMKLKENEETFFYSKEPCELDAVVFGHLFSILTTKLPNKELKQEVEKHQSLVDFCSVIEERYFKVKNN